MECLWQPSFLRQGLMYSKPAMNWLLSQARPSDSHVSLSFLRTGISRMQYCVQFMLEIKPIPERARRVLYQLGCVPTHRLHSYWRIKVGPPGFCLQLREQE